MAFFNFLIPLFITLTSYRLMEHKLSRSGHLQVRSQLLQQQEALDPLGDSGNKHDMAEVSVFCVCKNPEKIQFK